MKISMIVPVKNEKKTIEHLLNSIIKQKRKPDELIIVDGGSNDGTHYFLQEFKNKIVNESILYRVIYENNAMPGKGRNIGVNNSSFDVLCFADAGNTFSETWLNSIESEFKKNINLDAVYGRMECVALSLFEKCFEIIYFPRKKDHNGKLLFYPTMASFGIKKKAWKYLAGQDESLRAGEDLLFFEEIKKNRLITATAENAIAHWRATGTLCEALKKNYLYSKCDGIIFKKLAEKRNSILSRFIRNALFIITILILSIYCHYNLAAIPILIILIIVKLILTIKKNWEKFIAIITKQPYSIFLLIVIMLGMDISGIIGFLTGILFYKSKT